MHTRHTLVLTAATLFEQRGFARTRLSEVSSHAGVSSGALHFHFASKDVLANVVQEYSAATLHRAASDARDRSDDALQGLVDITHAVAARLNTDVVARAGLLLDWDAAWEGGHRLGEEWRDCVRAELLTARAEGALADEVSLADIEVSVVAVTTGFEALARQDPTWLSHQPLTGFWRLMLPQITAPAWTAPTDPAGAPVHRQEREEAAPRRALAAAGSNIGSYQVS
ncbi:TetR/AcrR family transcriptional regulator [Streptomyces tsukubensis]|uniref:HTH tetR-type domain-containing protein n=1 Tax=Streptomyces tsukubensis TaxID=83656 RepID=A0A1V3ZZX4_9ACTN|nr:TetR/AcrR family transcriptional regulator [Streptomyces tsukubensis]OON72070.1 hypothetical protein B1H18_31325 [Streptomyces tsukubensis]QFR93289.1 TetR family transcriptional regulator [Streptomyces tsukubensis]